MELDIDSVLKERKFFQKIKCGDDGKKDTPVPISNTVVKLINAESTWLETAWEDRKPLIKLKAHLRVCLFLYSFLSSQGTW